MDKTINNLRYEVKFENRVKDKNKFLIKRNIAFLIFSKKLFYSWGIFFADGDTKNIDMPRQKPRMLHW